LTSLKKLWAFIDPSPKLYIWISWLVIASGIILRFINLEADPPFWMDHWIGDEAYYLHNARNNYLFDVWTMDEINHGLYFSPLWSILQYGIFKFLGLNFFSFRILSAIFGSLTIVFFYRFIKTYFTPQQTFWAVIFTSYSSLSLHFSRVALGESFTLFFLLVALWLWMDSLSKTGKVKKYFCLASGFLLGLSLFFKITAIFNLSIFLILWLFQWRRKKINYQTILLFAAGFSCTQPAWIVLNWVSERNWWTFLFNISDYNIIKPGASFIWNLLNIQYWLTNFLWGSHPILWILFLVYLLWLMDRILVKKEGLHSLHPLEEVALAILAGGAISTFFLTYQPEQRILPGIWALSLLASILLSLTRKFQLDFHNIKDSLKSQSIWIRLGRMLILVFPLFFFIIYSISGLTERLPWNIGERSGIGFKGMAIVCSPLWIIGAIFSVHSKKFCQIIYWGSFLSLIFLGLSRFLVNLQWYFGLDINQVQPLDVRQKNVLLILFPVIIVGIVFLMRFNKRIIWKKTKMSLSLVVGLFGVIHFFQGMAPIIFPRYSVNELSKHIATYKNIEGILSSYHQTPLLLTRARLFIINNNSSYTTRLMDGRHYFGFNLVEALPKDTNWDWHYLNSWSKQYPLPKESKLIAVFRIGHFGFQQFPRYTFALWEF